MGAVIDLQSFRETRDRAIQEAHLENLRAAPAGDAGVSDKDIWAQDYATLPGMLRGIVNMRRILDVHLHFSEEWKYHLLDVLESVSAAPLGAPGRPVSETVSACKASLAEDLNVANRGDILRAMVILDLMESGAREAVKAMAKAGSQEPLH